MTTVSTGVESRMDEFKEYPTVITSLYLDRRPVYYIINIIIPCCLLSLIALFTFLLQPGSFDRLAIGTYAFLLSM